MYTEERIISNECTLTYRHYKGGGEETLFLFHGFGQTNRVFESFIPFVISAYSVVAIDLFFHGESKIEENEVACISIEHWNLLFAQILDKHQINRFSVLSYSMGSRFVVTLLNAYASYINKIVLIAPDGFGNNFWFRIATSTKLTRLIFYYSMQHPAWIKTMLSLLSAVGIFNSKTKRFIERNLESAEHRKKIYTSWVYFRKLSIHKDPFVELIRKNKIDVLWFCGREDQMVAKSEIQKLCNKAAARYVQLDFAHNKMLLVLEMDQLKGFLISNR